MYVYDFVAIKLFDFDFDFDFEKKIYVLLYLLHMDNVILQIKQIKRRGL